MKTLRANRGIAILGTLLLAAGCGAPNLTVAKIGRMQMQQTTEEQMKELFGDPDRSGLLNSTEISSCVYRYYEHDANPSPFVKPDLASLMVEMRDNRLIGYVFMTTRKSEATHFDEVAAKTLKPGQFDKDSVAKLLGPPAGHVLTPSLIKEVRQISDKNTKDVWVYTAGDQLMPDGGGPGAIKMLFIAFDSAGRMQTSLLIDNKLSYFF